jgi:hypothetical protein
MKTNSSVHTNRIKNRIYLVLEGYHDIEEATRMRDLYREAIESCRPGFTVLADLTGYKPGDDEVRQIHADAVRIAEAAGVSKVARVVGDKPLGGMQVDRVARQEGHYESAHFATVEEAEQYLDE